MNESHFARFQTDRHFSSAYEEEFPTLRKSCSFPDSKGEKERKNLSDLHWRWYKLPFEDGGLNFTPLHLKRYQLKKNLVLRFSHLLDSSHLQELLGLISINTNRYSLQEVRRKNSQEFFQDVEEDMEIDKKEKRVILYSCSPVWKCLGSKGLKHEHAEAFFLCRENRIDFSNYEARACGLQHSGATVDHMLYCCYSTVRHEKVLKCLLKMLCGWWVITEKNVEGNLDWKKYRQGDYVRPEPSYLKNKKQNNNNVGHGKMQKPDQIPSSLLEEEPIKLEDEEDAKGTNENEKGMEPDIVVDATEDELLQIIELTTCVSTAPSNLNKDILQDRENFKLDKYDRLKAGDREVRAFTIDSWGKMSDSSLDIISYLVRMSCRMTGKSNKQTRNSLHIDLGFALITSMLGSMKKAGRKWKLTDQSHKSWNQNQHLSQK